MHIVDTTMFFAPRSGGVKRYLLAKHAWLRCHTSFRHSLVVPAAGAIADDADTVAIAAPPLPGSGGYRLPLRAGPWTRTLLALAPDLIEVGDPYRVAWAALEAGQRLGVPVTAFYHSDLEWLLTDRLGRLARGPVRRYQRRLYQRFDLVFAPSRAMQARLLDLGLERTALQPLGVDTELFHPRRRRPELRRELGLAASTRLLVFAGRLSPEKHIDRLLAAFARLGPDYHLLLIGGKEGRRLGRNVTLYPYQDGGRLAALLASCDALVHAGDRETFGLVILEAMACGLPVVGVAAGAVPELVDASVGVLVPRSTVAALAAGVKALYERDLAALGAAARQRAVAGYAWDTVLRGLVGHYLRLVGRPVAAVPSRDTMAAERAWRRS